MLKFVEIDIYSLKTPWILSDINSLPKLGLLHGNLGNNVGCKNFWLIKTWGMVHSNPTFVTHIHGPKSINSDVFGLPKNPNTRGKPKNFGAWIR